MSEFTTIRLRSYDWPLPDSDLDKAMLAAWGASNIPLTGKVIIDRKHLNVLVNFMLSVGRAKKVLND